MTSLTLARASRALFLALLASVALVSGAGTASATEHWFVDEASLPFSPILGASAHWGVIEGAGYRIEVPANWNGDLVVYAHGYRGEGDRLFVSNVPIRTHLIQNGYAWAASSFAKNSYTPGQGAKDSHILRRHFGELIGKPDRVYLMGTSMGGHVTGIAIEQWPNDWDGALPVCGVMGDMALFDYFLSENLISQKLAGVQPQLFPESVDERNARNVVLLDLLGPEFPRVLNELGEQYAGLIENISGGPRPIFEYAWAYTGGSNGAQSVYTRGGGDSNRTNMDTVYRWETGPGAALAPDEVEFNDTILRVGLAPNDRRGQGLAEVPAIRGDLPFPVLSMHTLGDLFVPFSMQQIYAQRVAALGKSDLLVVRAIRDVNHCGFSVAEQARGFDDLVNWVVNGVKPAGDDILNPAAVAHEHFGCQFTMGTHTYNQNFGTGLPTSNVPLPACP